MTRRGSELRKRRTSNIERRTSNTQPSAARRRRRQKHRVIHWKRLALIVLLLMLTAEFLVAAYTSPWFYVRHTRVEGNVTIPVKDILGRVRIPAKSNIFLVKDKAIRKSVMANPVVLDARIHRRLPGTLVIKIVERKPSLILNTGGALYQIDASGVPFRITKQAGPKLPTILYAMPDRVILGKQIDSPIFNASVESLALAHRYGITRTGKITVDQNDDLCLNVRDGVEVRLGRPEQLARKIEIAAEYAKQSPNFWQHIKYIDVTCPEAPAYSPKD